MKIHLAGVRGSLPAPLSPIDVKEMIVRAAVECIRRGFQTDDEIREFLETPRTSQLTGYGGNTSCVEVSTARQSIIIDAGSGIRVLGLRAEPQREFHILFTHFHWDHLIGLMFYNPIFGRGNTVHLYAVQPELEDVIRTMFKKPCFPVNFDSLGAEVVFHRLEPRQTGKIGDIEFTPYQLDHPDPCWGYKIQNGGKVFSYCVDTECTRYTPEELGLDLPLYQGVDLMVFDAQYTIAEAARRVNWGHAAAPIGIDLAIREQIGTVYFVHHDPNATELEISEAERQTLEYYQWRARTAKKTGKDIFAVRWKFAQEGDTIILE